MTASSPLNMYAFVSRSGSTAYVILRVENNEKAIEVLKRTIIFESREGDMYWA
mgnify:CR=1 FL=1